MNEIKVFILIWISLSLTSCFESHDIIINESKEYKLYDYYIDSYGNEGIVAATDSGTKPYIIVVSIDESYQSWGPMGENVYKDSIHTIGLKDFSFGVAMLQAMKATNVERYPAEAWCNKKNVDEHYPSGSSWRLPTYEEMNWISKSKNRQHMNYLNSAIKRAGGTPISMEKLYWTCVEDIDSYISIDGIESNYDPKNRAIPRTWNNQTLAYKDRWIKKNRYFVRAIKYVYCGK